MKKRTQIIAGCAVLFTAALFMFTGCPTDVSDEGGSSIPSGILGETLTISGQQVYIFSDEYGAVKYTAIKANKDVEVAGLTLTEPDRAEITGGKLTVSITARPGTLSNISFLASQLGAMYGGWDFVAAVPEDARFASLSLYVETSRELSNNYRTLSLSNFGLASTQESVDYVYVDQDLTITGTGKTQSIEDSGMNITYTTKDFTLNLQAGWNAIYTKLSVSGTLPSFTSTASMSIGNPAFKWSYDE